MSTSSTSLSSSATKSTTTTTETKKPSLAFGALVRAVPADGRGERVGFYLRENGEGATVQVGDELLDLLPPKKGKDAGEDESGNLGTFEKL